MSTRRIFSQGRRGTLPADFDNWELTDDHGQSVAHVAAQYGHLPAGFDKWDIASPSGFTVAHKAAVHGNLPEDFDRWEMSDNEGTTVLDVYEYWVCTHQNDGRRVKTK